MFLNETIEIERNVSVISTKRFFRDFILIFYENKTLIFCFILFIVSNFLIKDISIDVLHVFNIKKQIFNSLNINNILNKIKII